MKDYLKRFAVLTVGLILCGLGSYIISKASAIGIGAWESFYVGMNMTTGIPYGTCCIISGFAIILIDILLKGKIGFGSILNAYLVGAASNFFKDFTDCVPETTSVFLGLFYIIAAYFIQLTGCYLYMKVGLGCGPRDTMNVQVGLWFPKVKISIVRFFLDGLALIAGVIMGAPFGIGTLVALTIRTVIMQIVYDAFKFEPRKVVHEDISDTLKKWSILLKKE